MHPSGSAQRHCGAFTLLSETESLFFNTVVSLIVHLKARQGLGLRIISSTE